MAPAISGSSDDYPTRPPIWPLYASTPPCKVYLQQTPTGLGQNDVNTRVEAGFKYGIPQLRSDRDFCSARQDYAHSQQEVVNRRERPPPPIPKKYPEYEVSQQGDVRENALTETAHLGHVP